MNLTDSSDVRRNATISFTPTIDTDPFLSIDERTVKLNYPQTPDDYSANPILTFQMSHEVPAFKQMTTLRCELAERAVGNFEVSLQSLTDILGRFEDNLTVRLEWQNDDLVQLDDVTLTRKRVFQVQQPLTPSILSGAETQNRAPQ